MYSSIIDVFLIILIFFIGMLIYNTCIECYRTYSYKRGYSFYMRVFKDNPKEAYKLKHKAESSLEYSNDAFDLGIIQAYKDCLSKSI